MKKLALLGATGSIGGSTLSILTSNPDDFHLSLVTGGNNVERIAEIIRTFQPDHAVITVEAKLLELQERVGNVATELHAGRTPMLDLLNSLEYDLCLNGIVGGAGMEPSLAVVSRGITLALSNKESLVLGGEVITAAAEQFGAEILPVDSEHNAIHQCLTGEVSTAILKLILTASGGSFLNVPAAEFPNITPAMATKHPNWNMGAKITVDSSTLMNKGLELIEAYWLFPVSKQQLDVVIHPQSIVHSMVEYVDGSVKAELGIPDMRIPIQYALFHPDRKAGNLPRLNLTKIGKLEFFEPDEEKFRCLTLAKAALNTGRSLPAVLNAANEIAVDAFLTGKIRFDHIPDIIAATLDDHQSFEITNLNETLEADRTGRERAAFFVNGLVK